MKDEYDILLDLINDNTIEKKFIDIRFDVSDGLVTIAPNYSGNLKEIRKSLSILYLFSLFIIGILITHILLS